MQNKRLWVSVLAGILALVMILGLFITVLPSYASAASTGELKSQINGLKSEKSEIDRKVKELQAQVSGNRAELKELVAEKDLIDQQIALMHEEVINLNDQISSYSLLIADKQDELVAAQSHLSQLNAKNKERIQAMEEDGNFTYWSVLFQSHSFADLLDRLNMIDEIAASDSRRLSEMRDAAQVVEETKTTLETEKGDLENTRAELDTKQEELEVKRAETDELLAAMKAKGDEFQALMDAAEDEQSDFAQKIAAKEKEYDAQKYREWLATSVPTTAPKKPGGGTTPAIPSSSGWLVPCSYRMMSSPFGYRLHPIYGVWKLHSGVDLAASQGTPIVASRSGVVTAASYEAGGAGNYVSINHGDGFASIYMHMTHYIVSAGQYVNAGQVIGYVGSTGASTGPHLHFGISYNGTYVNPANYINI